MRKIESETVNAVATGRKHWSLDNTETHTGPDGQTTVHLHGNVIATVPAPTPHGPAVILVSLAGWDTVTTRSRVNALLRTFTADAGVARVKGRPVLYVNGTAHEMDPDAFYPVQLSAMSPRGGDLLARLHDRGGKPEVTE